MPRFAPVFSPIGVGDEAGTVAAWAWWRATECVLPPVLGDGPVATAAKAAPAASVTVVAASASALGETRDLNMPAIVDEGA